MDITIDSFPPYIRLFSKSKHPVPRCKHDPNDHHERVAIGHQEGENRSRTWFSHWFVCPAYYEQWYKPTEDGPVTWHRVEQKVTLTYDDGRKYIWILQDQFDSHQCQLGVWPD